MKNDCLVSMNRLFGAALAGCLLLISASVFAAGKIAFISPAADTAPWWKTVNNGVKDAAVDFGVQVDYLYPADGSSQEMARIIDKAIASKYDALVVAMPDYAALKPALLKVTRQARIPLITFNSGSHKQSESIGAMLHVGQPDDSAGKAAGLRAKQAGIRNFVCLNHYAQFPASHDRCNGFAQGLGLKTAPELSLTGDAKTMQAQVAQYFNQHKNVEAIVTLGPPSAEAALNALKGAKLAKAPYFVSFDLSNPIIQAIKQGQMAFAIDQQPYLQGYLPIGLLVEAKKYGYKDLLMTKTTLYSKRELHQRVSKYGLTLLNFGERHVDSGPAFVERFNLEKVETYSGSYR